MSRTQIALILIVVVVLSLEQWSINTSLLFSKNNIFLQLGSLFINQLMSNDLWPDFSFYRVR